MRTLSRAYLLAFALLLPASFTQASPYVELGTSLGSFSNANSFFGLSGGTGSSKTGFMGAFNFYVPVTSIKNFFHFELGLSNRIALANMETPSRNLAMLTLNVAARLEISRFFVGAGYGYLDMGSSLGVNRLKPQSTYKSMFYEGGAIWRMVPELHVVIAASLESASSATGSSPSIITYGLLFRLPLDPYAAGKAGGKDWDGFRYPFGFMK